MATVDGESVKLERRAGRERRADRAIAVQRGMPARAATIALATAFQESKLYNIEYGDRDSLGLFQQRPSQGWGAPEEILDPVLRHERVLRRPGGGRRLRVDADHRGGTAGAALRLPRGVRRPRGRRPVARVGADRQLPRRVQLRHRRRCRGGERPAEGVRADPARGRRTPRRPGRVRRPGPRRVRARRRARRPHGGIRPLRRPRDRHLRAPDHAGEQGRRAGRSPSTSSPRPPGSTIQTVIFDDRIWTAGSRRTTAGATTTRPRRSGDRKILEHRDHVHVDVFD